MIERETCEMYERQVVHHFRVWSWSRMLIISRGHLLLVAWVYICCASSEEREFLGIWGRRLCIVKTAERHPTTLVQKTHLDPLSTTLNDIIVPPLYEVLPADRNSVTLEKDF